jgi:NADH-quinone oxidoreductase subunit G
VNKSWICDPGRHTHTRVRGLERLLRARVDGTRAEADAAAAEAGRRIQTTGARTGFVLGARATNEANWALLQLAKACGGRVFTVPGNDADAIAKSDDFLMDSDKNPNSAGARLLAAHHGSSGALRAALPELALLVVAEDDVAHRLGTDLPPTIFVGAYRNRTSDAAAIVLPAAHPVEMDGTWINRDGRVQRLRRALNPMGDSAPACQVLDRVGAAMGASVGTAMPVLAFNAMARAIPRMAGLDFKGLGAQGRPLAAPAAEPA